MIHGNRDAEVSASVALPTLLGSRVGVRDEGTEYTKCERRRPAPAELTLLEEVEAASGLLIKNTFLEGAAMRSPTLDPFYRERVVATCPARHVGKLVDCLREVMKDSPAGTPDARLATSFVEESSSQPDDALPTCAYITTPDAEAWRSVGPIAGMRSVLESVPCPSTTDSQVPQGRTEQQMPRCFLSTCPAPQVAPQVIRLAGVVSDNSTEHVEACADDADAGSARVFSCPPPPPAVPAPGTLDLPSVGSQGHGTGICKPCAFFHTKGCENGPACMFCHLCGPEEKKRRRREKAVVQRAFRQATCIGPVPVGYHVSLGYW